MEHYYNVPVGSQFSGRYDTRYMVAKSSKCFVWVTPADGYIDDPIKCEIRLDRFNGNGQDTGRVSNIRIEIVRRPGVRWRCKGEKYGDCASLDGFVPYDLPGWQDPSLAPMTEREKELYDANPFELHRTEADERRRGL